MSTSTLGLFLRHLALSEEVSRLGTASDHDLLAAYELKRGQAAFTELMRRYGPMVLRTCRRVLGHGADAEDAFQATFIMLARKAEPLRRDERSLGGWLHHVAYRTALKVLRGSVRRGAHERQASVMTHPHPDPSAEAAWNEIQPILDAELEALPDEARRLLIAHYLQEKSYSEVAAELGLPPGSIGWHLERARRLLAARLARRGITVSSVLLAILLEDVAQGAVVPAVLLVHTVEAARKFSEQATGIVSDHVARLVKGGLAQMTKGWTHWSMALAGWLGLLGAGLITCQTLKAWPDRTPESEPPATAKGTAPEGNKHVHTDRHGDPLPPGALERLGTMRLRHNAGVKSLVFTPDGKGLVTAGGENLPRLWDAATGKLLREFANIPKPQVLDGKLLVGVSPAILSPDGRILAVRSWPTCSFYLLETATGKRLHEFPCEPGNSAIFLDFAFSPDSKTIAAQLNDRLELRDVATGRTLWQKNKKNILDLAFSPDGRLLASSVGGEGVCLWDARTGKLLREVGPRVGLTRFAFSPDGRMLAIACPADYVEYHSLRLWDVATGQKVRQLSAPNKNYQYLAFSPDGKIVAARGKEGICLLDAATGKELRRCADMHHGRLCDLGPIAFSPDGKVLAALDGALVRFWDIASGKALPSRLPPGHESSINSFAFTPDGQTLISTAGDHTVRRWDTTTGQQRLCLPITKDLLRLYEVAKDDRRVSGACVSALSPDGTMLAVASVEASDEELPAKERVQGLRAGIRLLDAATGKELRRLDSGKGVASELAFSPDGKVLAEVFWGPSPRVRLWDVASGKRQRELIGGRREFCLRFSPDGSLLVTHNDPSNGVVHFWEVATGKEVHSLHTDERIECLALSPDGNVLATGSDKITLYSLSWDKSSGVQVGAQHRIASPPHRAIAALAFSPDGRMLASSSSDRTIHLWEMASGKERARFRGHSVTAMTPGVLSLCFTADGRRLASGSADSTILIWDVTDRLQDGQLRAAQLSTKELERCWADLGNADAIRAGRALWTLAEAPDQAVPYLKERLRTSAAEVKSLLAKVPQLLRDLDDDAFAVRKKARAELARLGAVVEPALRQTLEKSPSLEMRRSLEQILEELERKYALSGEVLRGVRTVEVLEQIGTREARVILKDLTVGFGAESLLTHEARAALERLDRAERR